MLPKFPLVGLLRNLHDLYRQMVVTTEKLDTLKDSTRETIGEFKRAVERLTDKIERIERERISAEAELKGRIAGLEARLDALSEKAIHVAVREIAESLVQGRPGVSAAVDQLTRERLLPPDRGSGGS